MLSWFPMLIIAITNGSLRHFTYGRHMEELTAHQLSSLSAAALFYGYTFLLNAIAPMHSIREALLTGFIWLSMTVLFEFIFGRYVAGHSWEKLLADYNIFKGRLWLLVLSAIFLSPICVFISSPQY